MKPFRSLFFVACLLAASMTVPSLALAQNDMPVTMPLALSAGTASQTYWTEERMGGASPMPMPALPASHALRAGTLAPGAAQPPPGPTVIANAGGPGDEPLEQVLTSPLAAPIAPQFGSAPFTYTRYRLFPDTVAQYKLFPYRLTGKLYFTIPGQGDYVCSAAVVNSANLSVVWTAGHCVYTPLVGFHGNFLFIPARRLGAKPFGSWTPKTVLTLVGWQSGLFEYDHGALVMDIGGSRKKKIGEALGFLGFLANAPRQQHWHLHGYPSAPRDLAQTPPGAQFDGVHHEICAAAWAANDLPTGSIADPLTVGVGCDKTGGTSGGPWVVDFSGVGGATNLLNGNHSYRYGGPNPPENLKLYSPYFTTGAINLRDAAQAVPVP